MGVLRAVVLVVMWFGAQAAFGQVASDGCEGSVGASDGVSQEKYSGIKFERGCPKAKPVETRMFFTVAQARNGSGNVYHGATARSESGAVDIVQNAIGDNFVRGTLRTLSWECPSTETWSALVIAFPNSDNYTFRQSGVAYGCGFSDPKVALRGAYEFCRTKGICNVSAPGWVEFWLLLNDGTSERLSRHNKAKRCIFRDGRFDNEVPCPFGDVIR